MFLRFGFIGAKVISHCRNLYQKFNSPQSYPHGTRSESAIKAGLNARINRGPPVHGLSDGHDRLSSPDFAGICGGGENFQSKVVGHDVLSGSIPSESAGQEKRSGQCFANGKDAAGVTPYFFVPLVSVT
jgi:hypothetical protein